MYLTADKITHAVVCAQEVLRDEAIFADDPKKLPVSIDDLRDYVAGRTGFEIEMREVSFDAVHLRGRVERFSSGRVTIDVRSSQDLHWKRFIASKELLHLIIDGEDDVSPYGDAVLEELVLEGHIGVISSAGSAPPAQSELLAEIAAMEVLYPMSVRVKDSQKYSGDRPFIAAMSAKYRLPQNIVSTMFNDRYIGFIEEAFRQLSQERKVESGGLG